MGLFNSKARKEAEAQREFEANERREEERHQRNLAEASVWVESLERSRDGNLRLTPELLARVGEPARTPHSDAQGEFLKAVDELVRHRRNEANIEMRFAEGSDEARAAAFREDLVFWASVESYRMDGKFINR